MSPHDASIGQRLEALRKARKLSVRQVAQLAGINPSSLSRIERGLRPADNRYLVADLAIALECQVTDITGQPIIPGDRSFGAVQAAVGRVRAALVEIDLDEQPELTGPRPLPALQEVLAAARRQREDCDYMAIGSSLPSLLRELHAHVASGPDPRSALVMLLEASFHAGSVVRYLGNRAEMWLAAERCRQAAQLLDEPVPLAFAAYERAHAATGAGLYRRALAISTRAIDALEAAGDVSSRTEMLGQLRLTAGFAAYGAHRQDEGRAWVDSVDELAARTGDTAVLGLHFGPTNTRFWRIAIETDGGDAGRAVEIARGTQPDRVRSVSRRVAFYSDTGRALAKVGNREQATRMLITAEKLAPHRVRASAPLQETARSLRQAASGSALAGLCERMGV